MIMTITTTATIPPITPPAIVPPLLPPLSLLVLLSLSVLLSLLPPLSPVLGDGSDDESVVGVSVTVDDEGAVVGDRDADVSGSIERQ